MSPFITRTATNAALTAVRAAERDIEESTERDEMPIIFGVLVGVVAGGLISGFGGAVIGGIAGAVIGNIFREKD